MKVVGFDFGTTNNLIYVVQDQKKLPINFFDREDQPIPSVVCYEGISTIVGKAARERLAQVGLGVHGNIVRSPKVYLGQDSVFIAGVERSPIGIVADVVRQVLHKARASGLDKGGVWRRFRRRGDHSRRYGRPPEAGAPGCVSTYCFEDHAVRARAVGCPLRLVS